MYEEITPEVEAKIWQELKPKITPEFMETLRLAAVAVGWTCDYGEVAEFVRVLGQEVGIPTEPYQPQRWPHNYPGQP